MKWQDLKDYGDVLKAYDAQAYESENNPNIIVVCFSDEIDIKICITAETSALVLSDILLFAARSRARKQKGEPK